MPNSTLFIYIKEDYIMWTRREGILNAPCPMLYSMENYFKSSPTVWGFTKAVNHFDDGINPVNLTKDETFLHVWVCHNGFDIMKINETASEHMSDAIIVFNPLDKDVTLLSESSHINGEVVSAMSVWWN